MEKGDNFEISEDSEIQYLVPGVDGDDVDIKERWNATNEPQGRWLLTHHQSFVCGFIKIDTDDHKGNKFGHSAVHGILIRRIGNPGDGHIQIKWSAHPLTSIPGEGDRANKCIDIDTPHHGGIAHARQ
jgi:hypothetical protein